MSPIVLATMARLVRSSTQRPEVDEAITARLSALPEERILDYFWLMVQGESERLTLLLQLSKVTVIRPASWDPAEIRRAHERGDGACVIERRLCFACDASQVKLYLHHIVEVHHGGSNAARNKVPLCFLCHQYLHPWLTEEPEPAHVNGFESIYEILRRNRYSA